MALIKRGKEWAQRQLYLWETKNMRSLNRSRLNFRVETQMWELLDKDLALSSEFNAFSSLIRYISPKISVSHTKDSRRHETKIDPPASTKGMIRTSYTQPDFVPKTKSVRNGQTCNPTIATYQDENDCRIYGSQVKQMKYEWRCLNVDGTRYMYAKTLEDLVIKCPHIVRPTQIPSTKPKPCKLQPSIAPAVKKTHRKGRPVAVQEYEANNRVLIRGYKVRLANGTWSCLNDTKDTTLTFSSLEELMEHCPYVLLST